ncbi:MAG: pitrilysin family protein [Planctomycetota bacterium]
MSSSHSDGGFGTHQLPVVQLPYERFELSCGGVLLVTRRAGAPVTALRAQMWGGSELDPKGQEGLAHLTGSLLDQGTTRHTDEELAAILEPEGGDVRGDGLGVSGAIVGSSWPLLVDIVAELITETSFPEERVEMQKKRLLTRLAVEAEDPRSQGARRFKKLVYGDHFLGRASHGDVDSLTRISAQDLRAHRATHWCGKRLLLAVAGDVDPAAVFAHVERAFAALPPGTPHVRAEGAFPALGQRIDVFERARNQVHVYLGHLGVKRTDPDWVPLVVMDHILGTGPGFTNRITRKLRDELGLAYSVQADIHSSAGLHPGTFTAYIGTSPEHLGVAIRGFRDEMRRIQDEPVSQEELDTAKSYLVGSFALGFERAARRAGYLITAERFGFPRDYLATLPRLYAEVSVADVQRVAQRYLFPDACAVSAAGPVTAAELASLLAQVEGPA